MKQRRRSTLVCLLGTAILVSFLIVSTSSGTRRVSAAGTTAADAQSATSAVLAGGSWSQIIQMADVPVHISLLPDGRLLYWGRDKAVPEQGDNRNPDGTLKYPYDSWDVQFRSRAFLWNPLYSYDPTTGAATPSEPKATEQIDNTNTNLFCSGHSFLQDGTLLVAGGHQRWPNDPNNAYVEGIGENDLNTFDYRTNKWRLLPTAMRYGRWYPRNLTLADGTTLIMSGTYLRDTTNGVWLNTTPEVFGFDGSLTAGANDPTFTVTYISHTYPFITLAPDGKIYYAGAPDDTIARFLDLGANFWTKTQKNMDSHDVGTAINYAPGKLMVAGGRAIGRNLNGDLIAGQASKRAQLMDLNQASGYSTPDWTDAQAMQNPRIHTNSIVLPDGKVLVAGGTRCPGTNAIKFNLNNEDTSQARCDNGQVLTPELWDPSTNSWTTMAAHQEVRVYHSTMILLPDARVLVAGSGLPAATGETLPNQTLCMGNAEKTFPCLHYGHKTAEVFSPPYLFESDGGSGFRPAVRPAITSVPASAAYGQQFYVGVGNVTPTSQDISAVVLIRLPSMTHGTDPDQRRVTLNYQSAPDGNGLIVTAPANGTECPPGPYMLFLIRNNGRGTPSFAKVIRIGDLSVDKTSQVFLSGARPSDSLTASVTVTAAPGTNWVVSSAPSWVTVTSGTSGIGNGTITFNAAANSTPGANSRAGTLVISIPGRNYFSHRIQLFQAAEFSDVAATYSFYSSVANISARQISGGCVAPNPATNTPGQFCPENNITRGQMAVFMVNVLGLNNLPVPQTPTFADVPTSHPFYKWIEAFGRLGITSGCTTGPVKNFCPDSYVTRGQMAAFIIRSLGVTDPPSPATPTFADVQTNHMFYRYIEEMARRGITGGCTTGPVKNFCPDNYVTRGQMAAFMKTAFGL